MLILALDTTTRGGSVAVTNDDQILALVPGDEARTHGERLPGEIDTALKQAGVSRTDVDLLAVATGPGAFTGLRIGLAAIQGLAMALDRPVAGISALDAIAWQARDERFDFVAPWMDAQRGDVFAALYGSGPMHAPGPAQAPGPAEAGHYRLVEPAAAASPTALLEAWRQHLDGHTALFVGDATKRDADAIARVGQGRWTSRHPDPLAPAIAALARQKSLAGLAGPPHALEPIYVRRPDAEIERERREQIVSSPLVERLKDAQDLEGVLAIEEASFNNPTTREWYQGELRREEVCFIYVIRTPEAPVAGFCAFWRVAEQLHINNLAIRPDLRGQGLGSQLLRTVLASAAAMGATRATLEVRRSNQAALRLYERAGFQQAGIRRNYYNRPVEDALVLVR